MHRRGFGRKIISSMLSARGRCLSSRYKVVVTVTATVIVSPSDIPSACHSGVEGRRMHMHMYCICRESQSPAALHDTGVLQCTRGSFLHCFSSPLNHVRRVAGPFMSPDNRLDRQLGYASRRGVCNSVMEFCNAMSECWFVGWLVISALLLLVFLLHRLRFVSFILLETTNKRVHAKGRI